MYLLLDEYFKWICWSMENFLKMSYSWYVFIKIGGLFEGQFNLGLQLILIPQNYESFS